MLRNMFCTPIRLTWRAIVLLFLFCCASLTASMEAQAAGYTWTGNSPNRFDIPSEQRNLNWHNQYNWTPEGIPSGGDSATIPSNSSTIFLDQPTTVQDLTLQSGDGNPPLVKTSPTNSLTVTGILNWSEGSIGFDNPGSLIIPAGATVNLLGPDDKGLYGVLNNAGTIKWIGNGRLSGGADAVFNNAGLINITAEAAYFGVVGNPGPVLNNTGTIRRSAGAGLFSIAGFDAARTDSLRGELRNSGLVDVQTGTFQFHGGTSSGSFNVATGALINVADTHRFDGNTITGAGTFRISGGSGEAKGTLTRNGGPLELLGNSFRGGFSDTTGSSATLSGTGKFLWKGGFLYGTWILAANLHTEASEPAAKYPENVTNKGTFDWLGGSPIPPASNFTGQAGFFNQGTFNCKAAGVFGYIDNSGILNTFAGVSDEGESRIFNSGIVNVGGSGTGVTRIDRFYNSGTLNLGVGDSLTAYHIWEATSKVNIDIAGAADGQFGQIKSNTSNNILNGTLTANFVNSYSPPADTAFRVVAAQHTSDSHFSSVKVQNLPAKTAVLVDDPNHNFEDLAVQNLALSINDVSVLEGNAGTTGSVNFTVTLSQPASQAVTVKYATANSTAIAPNDYTAKTGTLTIAAGQTKGIISIPIIGDALDEAEEGFFVNLSAPTGAFIGDNQGRGTIIDNDAAPTLSIADASVTEGNSGIINAAFVVTLSAPSGQTVAVSAIPSNGTATTPADYSTGGVRLTFAPGEVSKTFNVPVKSDLIDENNETFYVLLSDPTNAAIVRGRALGTINDDDEAPTISIDDLSVKEYNGGQTTAALRLKLSSPSGKVVRVSYETIAGTATAGSDYGAVSPTQVSFTAGNLYAYARVLINGDTLDEPNEAFGVNLSAPVNATIADNQATCTILDDDSAPALSIDDVSTTEGNAGTKTLTFTVTLSKESGQSVSVNYATANGTAVSTGDYVAKNGTLTFAPGSPLTQSISITINGDNIVEGDETLFVLLSGASNAAISKARGVGTITNDDISG